jgi:hypothetical protein
VIPNRRRVILFGDSVILAGIRASLSASPYLEVISLDQPQMKPAENLLDYHPDAVIFDLHGAAEIPLAAFQRLDLCFIGIDPETHEAVVWSGKHEEAIAAADLIDVIYSIGRDV